MKTIVLAPTLAEGAYFRTNAGLSRRECVIVDDPRVIQGSKFSEGDLILEWPTFREVHPRAQEIVDELKRAIARSANAGPEWVSSTVLTLP